LELTMSCDPPSTLPTREECAGAYASFAATATTIPPSPITEERRRLIAERDRLRAALRMIAQACAPGSAVENRADYAATIARAALEAAP
jgi:hypothetical protein